MWKNLIAAVAVLGIFNGCSVLFEPEPCSTVIEYEEPDQYYVDAYVYIPYEVREIIAGCVDGYSMPEVDMYGPDIFPDAGRIYGDNLPSYVKADFNGDGYNDFAYMFSRLSWSNGTWFLKSKMMVVVSTSYGYTLSAEYVLGTVSGERDVPVEEYWGIRLLERGTHTVSVYNDYEDEERISFYLENDGIYLGSLEPEERSVFYVNGTILHEFTMDLGAVAKRKVMSAEERANRVIIMKKK